MKSVKIPVNKLNLDAKSIIAKYESGLSIHSIAAELGCSYGPVKRVLTSGGISLRGRPENRIDSRVDEMVRDYLSGMSSLDVAKKYNCSQSPLLLELKKRGIKTRGRKGWQKRQKNLDEDYIIRSYKNGLSTQEIERELGCSNTYIRDTLMRHGIELRGKGKKRPVRETEDGSVRLFCFSCREYKSSDSFFRAENSRLKAASRCKKCSRDSELRKKFKITAEEYNNILSSQGSVCAICGKDEQENKRALSLDHCHSTGKIRGILCNKCNVGLGCFSDDTQKLLMAVEYLMKNDKEQK